MWRLILICVSCSTCLATNTLPASETSAPWVSCFADPPSSVWKGPKTVRTPLVTSADGNLRAYAVIEATADGPAGCLNTVRLFVSTQRSGPFRLAYVNKGSSSGSTANSLGPISWSPNGRWLLVEFGNWYYDSDAGGTTILLYDRTTRRVILPDLNRMVKNALKKECSIRIGPPFSFDALSKVHLRIADNIEEGEDEPETHCFVGEEEWVFNPATQTIRSILKR